MGEILYQAGEYILKRQAHPKHRPFKVVNLKGSDNHTHLRTEKEGRDLINFAIHRNIPSGSSIDYLASMERVVINKKLKEEIRQLIETKVDKKKGNQKHYINVNKGARRKSRKRR